MKRAISVIFAVVLIALSLTPLTVSAAETTDPQYIYFEVPSGSVAWNGFSVVYCHMWSKDGGELYPWQSKNEKCEDLNNGCWRYDLSGIDFDPEGEYSLIFSTETGMQTYNLNVTSVCRGDIAYCDGDTCVNPVDGEKSCAVARWRNNGEKVHPAIEVDSSGKTLNVDEVSEDEIETVWGSSEGGSYELPEAVSAAEADEETNPDSRNAADEKAEKEDGINLTAATTWIIIVSAAVFLMILALVIVLARKNRK